MKQEKGRKETYLQGYLAQAETKCKLPIASDLDMRRNHI